jgi:hypothetical protein
MGAGRYFSRYIAVIMIFLPCISVDDIRFMLRLIRWGLDGDGDGECLRSKLTLDMLMYLIYH